MADLAKFLLGAFGATGVIIFILFLFPERVEKWMSLGYKLASKLPVLMRVARRQYVKHDLASRVNIFTKRLRKDAPYLADTSVVVEWADPKTTRESFLKDDKVVLRLRRDDPDDTNFVHGAYLFVSASLLQKTKHYISPSHRESLDLYVTAKLIEREKSGLVAIFLDEYLHPRTADPASKIVAYFDSYERVHLAGLFFPVLVQELFFLGEKIFGSRRNDRIIIEVNDLIAFLSTVAERRIGQDIELNFEREYCRVAIVIVGKSRNLTPAGDVWINYLRENVVPKHIETVYLIGPSENRTVMDNVAAAFGDTYSVERSFAYRGRGHTPTGDPIDSELYLVIMRQIGVSVFKPS